MDQRRRYRSRRDRRQRFGVIVSDISNPFFAELVTAIDDFLEKEKIAVMFANMAENPERQRRAISTLLEHNVDGLLICPAKNSKWEHLGPLLNNPVPLVFINRYLTDFPGNYVGGHNILGAKFAAERLLAAGHRRIAFIGGSSGSTARRERLDGFVRAFEERGLTPDQTLLIETQVTRCGGYLAIRDLLSAASPPTRQITAAFCYNDNIAIGVLLGLQSIGIHAGSDFAVFGFDDISEARLWHPSLSTVSIPPELVGKQAARLLLDKTEDPDGFERVLIAPSLAIRESCGTQDKVLGARGE